MVPIKQVCSGNNYKLLRGITLPLQRVLVLKRLGFLLCGLYSVYYMGTGGIFTYVIWIILVRYFYGKRARYKEKIEKASVLD